MQTVNDFTAIISDDVWRNGFGDQRLVLTYGFADELPDHQSNIRDQAFRDSFSEHSIAAKATAQSAFDMWEEASALNFIEVDADQADLVIGLFDFDASAQTQFIDGFAFFPGESKIAGDIFINETSSTSLGLYLHEIGHALGLEHPFEGDLILPPELDTRNVTVMSSSGPSANELRDFDKQAIQFMYGPPSETPGDVIPAIGFANAFISQRSFFSNLRDLTYGDTGTVEVTVSNFGEDPFGSGIDVVLVLSKNEELGVDDFVIGSARVGDLAPNEQAVDVRVDYQIFDSVPASLTDDDYFVLIALDPTNVVAESRELDNVATVTVTTLSGVIGDNPGDSPPPFQVDPRTGSRDPENPPPDTPEEPVDPPEEPVDPPEEPVDPPEEPVDPPEEPVDPPEEPVDPPEEPVDPPEEPVDPPEEPVDPPEEPVDPPEEPVDPPEEPVDPPEEPVDPPEEPVDPPEEPVDPPEEPVDPPEEPVDPPEEPVDPPVDPNAPTEGNDVLLGTNSADQIDGGGGADLLTGAGGGDTLNGGSGGDTLIGNGGRDQLVGGGGKDSLEGGGGSDTLIGNGGSDTLKGGGGKDDLQGGGGKDLLVGGGGRDMLDGGGGKDTMEGGNGRDVIIGGRGVDVLTGNGGADRFVFDRGNGRDTITDFQQGRDKIEIEGGADDFDDLGIFQLGDDVMIRISNTRVIVEDDLADNFTAGDFIF